MADRSLLQAKTADEGFYTRSLVGAFQQAIVMVETLYHVDEKVMCYLADAVFAAYVESGLILPFSTREIRGLAVSSVALLREKKADMLRTKH